MKKIILLLTLYVAHSQAQVKVFYPEVEASSKDNVPTQSQPQPQPQPQPQAEPLPNTPPHSQAVPLPQPKTPTSTSTPPPSGSPQTATDELAADVFAERTEAAKEPAQPDWFERTLGISDVKPWEKGHLAEDALSPEGAMPAMNEFRQKVFISKENTTGGYGISGSGCGCN